MTHQIVVSAVVFRNAEGLVLTARKRGTHRFMFPGGKLDPGETPSEAAIRECAEELGVRLNPEALTYRGEFVTDAANEDGCEVRAFVFEHPCVEVTEPRAEIAELAWFDPRSTDERLAPLCVEAVFPMLVADDDETPGAVG